MKMMKQWCFSVVLSGLCVLAGIAQAGTGAWIGASGGNWSDAANWLGELEYASGTGSTAYFTNGAPVTVWQNVSGLTLANLSFANANTMITNNTITLDNSGGAAMIAVDGNSVTADVGVALSPTTGTTLTKTGSGTLLLNKPAGVFGGMTVNEGLLLVGYGVGGDGLNVGNGTITINSGATLRYLDNNLINNYAVLDVKSGGVLDFNNISDNIGAFTGDGVVSNMSQGLSFWLNGRTLKFSGQCNNSSTINFRNPGVFVAGSSNALQNLSLALNYPGILAFDPSESTYYVGALSVTNKQTLALQDTEGSPITLALGSRNDTFVLPVDLTGRGGLTKVGTGTLTLTNAQAYAGATAINGGSLQFGNGVNDGSATNSSSITIGPSGTLAFNPLTNQTNHTPIFGSGKLTKAQSSTLALGAFKMTNGAVTVNAGTFMLNDGNSTGTTFTVNSGAMAAITGGNYLGGGFTANAGSQLVFDGGSGTGATLTVSTANPIRITGGTHQFVTAIGQNNARYVQTGGASQFIGAQGNSNTNQIFAVISGGTLSVANIGAWPQGLGLLISSNAAVTISDGPNRAQRLASDGKSHTIIITNNASLTGDSLQLLSSGNSSSTSRLDLAGGVFTIKTINNSGGATTDRIFVTFNGGLLKCSGNSTLVANPISTFNVLEGGAHIDTQGYIWTINQPLLSGALSGADGGLTKYGTGFLQTYTNNTYTGPTTVKAGTLKAMTLSGTPFGSGSLFLNSATLQTYPAGSGQTVALTAAEAEGATLTFGPGAAQLGLAKGGNSSVTLTLGNNSASADSVLSRTVDGGALVVTPASGTSASNLGVNEKLLVNGGVTPLNGMVSPTVFGVNNDDRRSCDFLTYDGTSGFVLPAYTPGLAGGATSIANVTSSTSSDSAQVYALRVHNGATLTVNNGQTLTVGDGVKPAGVILNNSSGVTAGLTGGTLDFGTSEGVVIYNLRRSNIYGPVLGSTITGSGGLTLVGGSADQDLQITSTDNPYTGGTRILSGRVTVTGERSFGDGDISVYGNEGGGGQFQFTFTGTMTNAFHLAGVGPYVGAPVGAVRFDSNSALSGSIELMDDTRIGVPSSLIAGTLSGSIWGPGGLEINCPNQSSPWGTVVLSGANSYTGMTRISGGTLKLSGNGTFGTGPIVNDATLVFDNNADLLITNAYSGSGDIILDGAGTIALAGQNADVGLIAVNAGILDLDGNDLSVESLGGTGRVSNTSETAVTLVVNGDSDSQFRGVIANGAGTLALSKTGSGTLTLNGANTYSGSTIIGDGVLKLASAPTLPTNGIAYQLDASDASTLTLVDGTNVSVWADSSGTGVDFTQSVAHLRPVYVTNSINGQGAVYFQGMTNRLVASQSNVVQTLFAVNRVRGYMGGGGFWGENKHDHGIRQASLTSWPYPGNGNDFTYNGQLFINGIETNSFDAGEPHILTAVSLTAKNLQTALGDYWASPDYWRSYQGDVGEVLVYTNTLSTADRQSVEAYLNYKWMGIGSFMSSNVLSVSTALSISNNATFDLNGVSQEVASLSGSGSVINSSDSWSTLTVGNDNTSTLFSGVISGSNALAKVGSGTLTLGGANTYLGNTLVSGGTLKLSDGSLPTSSTVTVDAGATLDLNGQSQSLAGIAGSGSVVNGTLTVTGLVSPGGNGVVGTLTLSSTPSLSGTLLIDTRTNGDCDVLSVTGDLDLSTLSLEVADKTQMSGFYYIIATCSGDLIGTFSDTNLSKAWSIQYDRTAGEGKVILVHNLGTLIQIK